VFPTCAQMRIKNNDHLRAVLNGPMDRDWLIGNGEQRTIPQPVIASAKKKQ